MQSPSRHLMCFQPRPEARVRLACLPHAGGSAFTFAGFGRALPPEIEVVCVQRPGRDTRGQESLTLDFRELIAQLAAALAELHDRPYVLLGYSMGALLAFELTRKLRRDGRRPPLQLLVSAARPPQHHIYRPISHLPREELVRIMTSRYDGIPQKVLDNPQLLDYFLPTLISDIKLLESYCYEEQPPLDVPIHAFGGDKDPRVSETDLRSWQQHTSAAFSAQLFPGGHFFLQTARDPYLQALADKLLQAVGDSHSR